MALKKGDISTPLKKLINQLNSSVQENSEVSINTFCELIENVVFDAIKKADITIQIGKIQVQGSPSAQSNINQIVLEKSIS